MNNFKNKFIMYDKLSNSVEISAYMKKIKVECSKVLFSK